MAAVDSPPLADGIILPLQDLDSEPCGFEENGTTDNRQRTVD